MEVTKEIRSLENLLSRPSHPHAFLFHGEVGCGKTTAARICAQLIGAKRPESVVEINTADNRGIDTARSIIDSLQFRSFTGEPLVFILDEVHQTSKDFMNGMLKPLEDCPDWIYFFLCTTDPTKIIPALKSRCVQVYFPRLKPKELMRILKRVCESEGGLSDDVIEAIAYHSEGNPRNALVLLEKVLSLESEEEMIKVIKEGVKRELEIVDLCRALLNPSGGWKKVSEIILKLHEEQVDVEKIRRAVLGYMSKVLLKKQSIRNALIIEFFSEPFYNSGYPGLILACFRSYVGK